MKIRCRRLAVLTPSCDLAEAGCGRGTEALEAGLGPEQRMEAGHSLGIVAREATAEDGKSWSEWVAEARGHIGEALVAVPDVLGAVRGCLVEAIHTGCGLAVVRTGVRGRGGWPGKIHTGGRALTSVPGLAAGVEAVTSHGHPRRPDVSGQNVLRMRGLSLRLSEGLGRLHLGHDLRVVGDAGLRVLTDLLIAPSFPLHGRRSPGLWRLRVLKSSTEQRLVNVWEHLRRLKLMESGDVVTLAHDRSLKLLKFDLEYWRFCFRSGAGEILRLERILVKRSNLRLTFAIVAHFH